MTRLEHATMHRDHYRALHEAAVRAWFSDPNDDGRLQIRRQAFGALCAAEWSLALAKVRT